MLRDDAQPSVGPFPEHLVDQWIDGDDPVAGALQVASNTVARPPRVGAQANHGDDARRLEDPFYPLFVCRWHLTPNSTILMVRIPSRLAPIPEEIIEAFRAVAPTIENFAREHELALERYRHGKAAWELTVRPLQGGEATLTIGYRERTGHLLDISAVWWVDDLVSRTRRLRSDKIGVWERRATPGALRAMLEEGIQRINGWTGNDLGPPRGPYPAAREGSAGSRSGSG
jgi:hypothetical protein